MTLLRTLLQPLSKIPINVLVEQFSKAVRFFAAFGKNNVSGGTYLAGSPIGQRLLLTPATRPLLFCSDKRDFLSRRDV